jgi:hypothetical protein
MKEDTEFSHIGKGNPYAVPAGFFEDISEKTLQKAIMREHIHRKSNIRRIVISVAASVTVLLFLGYQFGKFPEEKTLSDQLEHELKPSGQTIIQKDTVSPGQIAQRETILTSPSKTPIKKITESTKTEGFSDLLSDMSDDELLEVAALVNTDPFIDETMQ